MHVGSNSTPSKTECLFSPTPGHFKILTLPSTAIPTDSSFSHLEIPKQKKKNEGKKQKRNNQKYEYAEETKPIRIGKTFIITITRHFRYLGSYISHSLKYDYEIEHSIFLDSAAMGALNNFCADNTVDNFSKHLIFCAITCNLLLWGCGSWEIHEATLNKLEVISSQKNE